jgi:hypothetical protein
MPQKPSAVSAVQASFIAFETYRTAAACLRRGRGRCVKRFPAGC